MTRYRLEWSLAGPYGELHRWSAYESAGSARSAALSCARATGARGLRLIRRDPADEGDEADALPDAATLLAWDVLVDGLPQDGEGNPLLKARRAAERADAFARDLLRLTAAAARDGVIPPSAASELQDAATRATGRPDPRWPRGRPA